MLSKGGPGVGTDGDELQVVTATQNHQPTTSLTRLWMSIRSVCIVFITIIK